MNLPTTAKPLAKTASEECRPELWRLLTDRRPSSEVVPELALAERGAVEAALPALEAHAAPCGPQAVIAALVPLVTLYGVPDKSEKEWAAFWRFYTEALGNLPLEALKAGVAEYVRASSSEFFPKPGPLLALCNAHAGPITVAAWRARACLKFQPPPKVEMADIEERKAEAAKVAALFGRNWKSA